MNERDKEKGGTMKGERTRWRVRERERLSASYVTDDTLSSITFGQSTSHYIDTLNLNPPTPQN